MMNVIGSEVQPFGYLIIVPSQIGLSREDMELMEHERMDPRSVDLVRLALRQAAIHMYNIQPIGHC